MGKIWVKREEKNEKEVVMVSLALWWTGSVAVTAAGPMVTPVVLAVSPLPAVAPPVLPPVPAVPPGLPPVAAGAHPASDGAGEGTVAPPVR